MKSYSKRERERNILMYEGIISLKDVEEAIRFFDDLLSITELRAIEQRFQVAKLLSEGHIYNAILDETGASSATISRVNRSLQYGAGGYDIVLNRLKQKEDNS